MLLTFSGSQGNFIEDAFFHNGATNLSIVSASTTEIVLINAATGFTTTVTGSGFAFVGDSPVGGTITSMTFTHGGVTQATLTGANMSVVAFDNALQDIESTDDHTAMAGLLTTGGLTVDASTATDGLVMNYDLFSAAPNNMTIIGSDYQDTLVGGAGNDSFTPGENDGEEFIAGSLGNDTYDYTQSHLSTDDGEYELYYGNFQSGITATLNGVTNTGSVTATGSSDTLLGLANVLDWEVGKTMTSFSVATIPIHFLVARAPINYLEMPALII